MISPLYITMNYTYISKKETISFFDAFFLLFVLHSRFCEA